MIRNTRNSISLKRSLELSSALFLSIGLSMPVFAQSTEFRQSYDGYAMVYSGSDLEGVESLLDNTGKSPDRVHRYFWNADKFLTALDGPHEGDADTTTIDWQNGYKLKIVTNALGHQARFEFNELNEPVRFTSINGLITVFNYDSVSGLMTSYTTLAETNRSATTRFLYDVDGKMDQISLPNGSTITELHGSNAKPTLDFLAVLQNLQYLRQLPEVKLPSQSIRSKSSKNFPHYLSPRQTTEQSKDENGLIISGVDANGGIITYKYDEYGNVSEVRDARGVSTKFVYNGFGDVVEEDSAERGITRYKYDGAGNVVKMVRADGLVLKRKFDILNRLVKEVAKQNGAEKKVVLNNYDDCENGIGRLCNIISDGIVTKYAYNIFGDVTKVSVKHPGQDNFEVTRYSYNDQGQMTRLHYPTGLVVRYHHDDEGYVRKVTGKYDAGEDTESFLIARNIKLDPNTKRLSNLTYGNGLKTAFSYEDDNRLHTIETRQNGRAVESANYSYDTQGNVTAIARLDPARSQGFSYDSLDRLTSEVRGGISASATSTGYAYDAVGNRKRRDRGAQSRNYQYAPNANRLDAIGNKPISYDALGNMVEDKSGKRVFGYDVTNRLTSYTQNGELKTSYRYNAQGQRVSKTLYGGGEGYRSLHFAYTPDGWLLSELGRSEGKAKVFARDYVWLGSRPLAQIERKVRTDGTTAKAKVTYLHTDHLNTPRSASNEVGETVWNWNSDAFGVGKPNRDVDGDGKKTVIRLRFPGQYHDRDSGLFYNHNRDYDPKLGRYIQSDPIGLGGGINRYAYANSNPLNYTDPTGLRYGSYGHPADNDLDCYTDGWVEYNGRCVHPSQVPFGYDTYLANGSLGGARTTGSYWTGNTLVVTGTRTSPFYLLDLPSPFGTFERYVPSYDRGYGATQCASADGVCVPPATTPSLPPNTLPCSSDFLDAYNEVNYDRYRPDESSFFDGDDRLGLLLGGNVNTDIRNGSNTCSIRASCALNRAGLNIPSISGDPNDIPGSTIFGSGPNQGTRVLYDTRAFHAFLTSVTAHTASNLSASQIRSRLSAGQVAIAVRQSIWTTNADGSRSLQSFGHVGVVTTGGYEDPFIPRTGNDVWFLPVCPA